MKKQRKRIQLSGLGMAYTPAAIACNKLEVDTPDSMGFEIHEFLKKLIVETGGDVTEFVRRKLGYTSYRDICDALAAEQIDGVAMAIFNIERRRQGIIIGDQTGIGKGRQAAAVIRYGVQQGLKPIFITEKPNLFSDLYRDMAAIGSAHLKPFIVNADEEKTRVKDENGNVVYTALPNPERNKIIQKASLPAGFDYIMLTYSQLNSSVFKKVGNSFQLESLSPKAAFINELAKNNIIILDESHNASGDSNTGRVLQDIVSAAKGATFLSATFAKRPDNMPVYAIKTAMSEAALNKEQLIDAITKGGVALQEVLSSQLVNYGQMIRRERSYEGIEVNYIYLKDREQEHRAISDNITEIMRDIISFQENYVDSEIEGLNTIIALESPNAANVEKRKGTEKAGASNTEYFSKIFNVINQMLFAIKAQDVADRSIMRLKEGKSVVIAFSSTMGSFLESITDENGMPVQDGSKINADFGTVLMRGLDGVLRYTVREFDEEANEMVSKYEMLKIEDLSAEARAEYNNIVNKIKRASTGILVSPIDLIKQRIQDAGYKVAEITGRKLELSLKEVSADSAESLDITGGAPAPKASRKDKKETFELNNRLKKLMPVQQQKAIRGNDEIIDVINQLNQDVNDLPEFGATNRLYSKFKKENPNATFSDYEKTLKPILHYFIGGSDFYIFEYDEQDQLFYGFTVLNGDWQNAEYGDISVDELLSIGMQVNVNRSGSFRHGVELDFYYNRNKSMYDIKRKNNALDGIERTRQICSCSNKTALGKVGSTETKTIGTVKNRKKENVFDAFRRFNDNEVDVLLINQSGATGASAHAMPTKKVKNTQVRQRVMEVLQAELDINKEVQKRGRINRTGQIMKPIYDYVISMIPAEARLMMMLQKKLKSLDANTSSNQKQSESLLSVADFLNKYGDKVVSEYLIENPDMNEALGDLMDLKQSSTDNQKTVFPENISHKASGRVAVLDCKTQERFYADIMDRYNSLVDLLKQQDEYDLEVETMDLQAQVLDQTILTVGRGGNSAFGDNTILNKCEVNIIKKPFNTDELSNILIANLDGKEYEQQAREIYFAFTSFEKQRIDDEIIDITNDTQKRIENITNESKYKKIPASDFVMQQKYMAERRDNIQEAAKLKAEKARNTSRNRSENLESYFKYFVNGRKCYFPNDVENASTAKTLSVFCGYKFNMKAKNPWAPSAIKACFAIASAKKYIELPLSYTKEMQAIRGASGTTMFRENWHKNNDLATEWSNYVKQYSGNDRGRRYIITGNLLQAFGNTDGRYKGKLISYTTIDGLIKKGILLPDTFSIDRDADNNFTEQLTSVPIYKARKPIAAMSVNSIINSDNSSLNIARRSNDWFEFILSKSKSVAGNIYLDTELLPLLDGEVFNTVSGSMMGKIHMRNLETALEIMQRKHGVTVKLREWQVDMIQDEIETNKGSDIVNSIVSVSPDGDLLNFNMLELEAEALALELELLEL